MLPTANRLHRAPDPSLPSASPRSGISALAAEIAAACREPFDAMRGRIKAALAQAVRDPDLLGPEQRETNSACYARHVLHADPHGRFTILAIVWDVGQFSPPHAHHTWCGYAVYENPLEETVFGFNATASRAEALRTEVRDPGYSCFAGAGLDQIHRLGNSGPGKAISIHVYGVERERIATHVNRVVDVAS